MTGFTTIPPYAARVERLRAVLALEGLDGLLVTHMPGVRYLTGFTGSSGFLLLDHALDLLITDFR